MLVSRKASKSVRGPVFFHTVLGRVSHYEHPTDAPCTTHPASMTTQVVHWQRSTRGLATPSGGSYDAVVIGGGTFALHIQYPNQSILLS